MAVAEEPHRSQTLINGDKEEYSRRRIRTMAHLKASVMSKFAESKPSISSNASPVINHRLHRLFASSNTPRHPAYALMIRRAIAELDEEDGSTKNAISYFIQKEYKELPWAHEVILSSQLRKLCQDKELVCNAGGRYALDHGVDHEGCGERKVKVAEIGEDVESGNELQEGGIRDKVLFHDSDSCSDGEESLSQSIESVEEEAKSKNGPKERSRFKKQRLLHELDCDRNDEPIRVLVSTQEKEKRALKQSVESVKEQEKSEKGRTEVAEKQRRSKQQGTIILRHTEAPAQESQHTEAPAQESQHQDSILQSEPICSSSPTELNASKQHLRKYLRKYLRRGRPPNAKPAADNHGDSSLPLHGAITNALKFDVNKMKEQWLSQPQGRGIGRGRLRKKHKILKNKTILAHVNVDNEQPQYGNQGNLKRKLSDNPISGDLGQNPPKRPRGRPPKLITVANNQGEPSRGRGTGRGRGRPPLSRRDADHYEKQLQNEHQALQQGRGRGRGSRGRGRGRSSGSTAGSSGRPRGRPRKLNSSTNPSEEQSQPQYQAEDLELKASPKLPNSPSDDAIGESPASTPTNIPSEEHSQPQYQAEGLELKASPKPPNPPSDDAIGEPPASTPTNIPSEEQSQPQYLDEGLELKASPKLPNPPSDDAIGEPPASTPTNM